MVVGCRGSVSINPRFLMLPEASIKGVALSTSTSEEYRQMGAAIVGGIEAGWVTPVINREYAMEEVQQVRKGGGPRRAMGQRGFRAINFIIPV